MLSVLLVLNLTLNRTTPSWASDDAFMIGMTLELSEYIVFLFKSEI